MIKRGIRKIYKLIVPKSIQNRIRNHRRQIKDKQERESILKRYSDLCDGFSGFVALPTYVKTDRVFGGMQYYSQFYQDYFLDSFIFRGKRNGFFLDVGGNDPIYINNTYFFEKERGWNGLAFEPMPEMNKKWKEIRRVECIQAAVGSSRSTLEFREYKDDYMSGMANIVDYNGEIRSSYVVDVVTIGEVLKSRSINHIDFMSIDIEGAELDALKGIDFDSTSIDYVVIENNRGKDTENCIRNHMLINGYELIARLWIDDVWRKGTD